MLCSCCIPEAGEMTETSDQRWILILAIFILTQFVYLSTLAPTVTSEDSGELIAAAYTTGVAHPPGFPLWTVLSQVFTQTSSESPAWVINYMSAFLGSLTACVLLLICLECGVGMYIGFMTVLMFAFSRRFWSQAIIAEVYTLNTLLFFGSVYFLIRFRHNKRLAFMLSAALCFGLGVTNHYMLTLLIAPVLFIYWVWTLYQPQTLAQFKRISLKVFPWKWIFYCLIIIAASLSIYLYLPWAASKNPVMNWGDPSNFERFMALVKRESYQNVEFGSVPTIGTKFLFVLQFLYLMLLQFTPYICIPGMFLIFHKGFKRPAEWYLFWGVFLMNGLCLLAILRFTFEVENRSRVEEYYLQAWGALSLLIAMGLHTWLKDKQSILKFSLPLLCPLLPLLSHYQENNLSKYYLAYDYNKTILESLEKNAVYFPSGDYNSFPAIYFQAVEGLRPDVIIADITGDLSAPARAYLKKLGITQETTNMRDSQFHMASRGDRPLYFSSKNDCKIRKQFKFNVIKLRACI